MRYLMILLLLGLTGCAADADARALAKQSLNLTQIYSGELDKKIEAEKNFYNVQNDNLRRSLLGGVQSLPVIPSAKGDGVPDSASAGTIADPDSVKNSLLYGRIFVHAERDARVLADQIIASSAPSVQSAAIAYVSSGVQDELADYQLLRDRREAMTKATLGSVEKLDSQKTLLKEITSKLQLLSRQPTSEDQLKEYAVFAEAVAQQLGNK